MRMCITGRQHVEQRPQAVANWKATLQVMSQFQVKFSNMSELRPLLPDIALWHVEKLRLSEIKQRLQAADLSTVGNKRTLSKRRQEHVQSLAGESEETETSDASDTERAQ